MTRTMLTLAVGVAISVGGLTLAQTGHGQDNHRPREKHA